MKKTLGAIALASISITGCKLGDPNDKPVYGESGLPVNCRALIAEAIDGWRSGLYKPTESLESIERNCGRNGYTWGK